MNINNREESNQSKTHPHSSDTIVIKESIVVVFSHTYASIQRLLKDMDLTLDAMESDDQQINKDESNIMETSVERDSIRHTEPHYQPHKFNTTVGNDVIIVGNDGSIRRTIRQTPSPEQSRPSTSTTTISRLVEKDSEKSNDDMPTQASPTDAVQTEKTEEVEEIVDIEDNNSYHLNESVDDMSGDDTENPRLYSERKVNKEFVCICLVFY